MYGVVLHAHPVRGESHNQRNTTGEVATIPFFIFHGTGFYLGPLFSKISKLLWSDVWFRFNKC